MGKGAFSGAIKLKNTYDFIAFSSIYQYHSNIDYFTYTPIEVGAYNTYYVVWGLLLGYNLASNESPYAVAQPTQLAIHKLIPGYGVF